MTRKEAIELSIKKWEWIVGNGGVFNGVLKIYPELESQWGYCPLCTKYQMANEMICEKCPIRPRLTKDYIREEYGCWQEGHPFGIFSDNNTVDNAQAVLDLLKERKNK